jgi:N-methylhydantoinase A
LRDGVQWNVQEAASEVEVPDSREAYFSDIGLAEARVLRFEDMERGAEVAGPAIIESSFTTVVVDPGASATRSKSGSLIINPVSGG